ncbi:MAG: hypothetical protein H9W81_01205, partial [Enterococcus sp.]|nr:hypothetical protein [Enterococcus sp.]
MVEESYVMPGWTSQDFNQVYTLTPDASGNFQITVTAPEGALSGTIKAGFRFGQLRTDVNVNVVEAPAEETPVEPSPEPTTPPVEETPETPEPTTPPVETPEEPEPTTPPVETPAEPEPTTPPVETPAEPEVPVNDSKPEVPAGNVPKSPVETPKSGEVNTEKNIPSKGGAVDNGIRATVDNVLSGAVVLDESNRGDFVLNASEDGKVLTFTGLIPGETYEIWLHSNPLFAGKYVADENGAITLDVPDALEDGQHKAVIYADGELVGWQDFSKGNLAYT